MPVAQTPGQYKLAIPEGPELNISEEKEMEAPLLGFDQFRKNAAECIRLAEEASPPAHKLYFIEMAQRWLTLAEHAKATQDR